MPSGFIIRDVKDAFAAALQIIESANEEALWPISASINSLAITQGFVEKVRAFIQRGGVSRGVVPISPGNIAEIRTFLDVARTSIIAIQ